MDGTYYRINLKDLSETIDTNDKKLKEYLKDAMDYYKLNIDFNILDIKCYKNFKLGDFILYLLSIEPSFDTNTNVKIVLIKEYLNQCVINNTYFNKTTYLAFLRDVLQIGRMPSYNCFADNYYKNEDIDKGLNKKDIKTRLKTFKLNEKKIVIRKEYICNNILEFIIASLYEIVSNYNDIHKCINCGKIFLNNSKGINTNTRYCNYISPQNKRKTCFEYRKTATSSDIRKNNGIYTLHNDISNLLRKRRGRAESNNNDTNGEDNEEVQKCQKLLNDYQYWYKTMKNKLKNKEISTDELTILLKEKHINYIKEWKENGSKRTNKK